MRLTALLPASASLATVAALPASALLVTALLPAALSAQLVPPLDHAERVEEIFADWDSAETPGCAAGVAIDGLTVLADAWGMADLEWGIPSGSRTIYENGSVSKQFTAAAVVLLALDGALDLDDDIREYIPELPDYGETITITHLMNHTSGLRDWGGVAGISGWGREQRTHDHDHVLDILSRQTALNFPPGHEYSYSNSGYNLLAILVERVSGQPFADFSRDRIFEPLGMLDTQWRDDYQRIVPGRATAYARAGESFEILQPIENVHGNGGLLTTVHDLLTWNAALDDARFGDEFVRLMEEQGRLNDGRTISYARGLVVGEDGGLPTVTHTGATSGYRAYLGRYPDQGLSVAVLCNVANASPGGLGGAVAEVYLGDLLTDSPDPVAAITLTEPDLERWSGTWVDEQTGASVRVGLDDGLLEWGGQPLYPARTTTNGVVFVIDEGVELEVRTGEVARDGLLPAGDATAVLREDGIEVDGWRRVPPVETVDDATIADYTGLYESEDAETELTVAVEEGDLFLVRRPDDRIRMQPVYEDAFVSGLGLVRFIRDASGAVTGLTLYQSRVYDMRFERVE